MSRIPDAASILIVDDEATLRERLAKAFRSRGYETLTAADCDEAIAVAKEAWWTCACQGAPGSS